MDPFGAYARYYDLLYRDKDYQTEAIYVHEQLQRAAPGAQSVLELGCGTGAHAVELLKLGYEVHGVDISSGMLEAARVRRTSLPENLADRLTLSSGDVRNYRTGGTFDVVIALFHVVSYQESDEDLIKTFTTAAAHLKSGGVFLFDFWYGPAVLADPPAYRQKCFEDVRTRVQRTATPTMFPERNVTEVDYHIVVTDLTTGRIEEIRESHRMRYLFAEEIKKMLFMAGLNCQTIEGWRTGSPPNSATWSAVAIARKPR